MTATWSSPRTWVTGEIVTAALLNAHLRDNMDWLKSPTDSGRVQFEADFSSSSISSYTDLTGVTTTMTTNGGGLDVHFRCIVSNSTPANVFFRLVIDGASVALIGKHFTGNTTSNFFYAFEHVAAISSGSHTIKIQIKCASGTTVVTGTTAALSDPLFYVVERGD